MAPAMKTVMLRELAAGSSSGSINRGMIAPRVGWLTAKNACCTENSPNSTQTFSSSRNACTAKRPLVTIRPSVVMTSRVRRSKTSASAPPQSPKTTSGTRPNSPVSPTYADEPVIA